MPPLDRLRARLAARIERARFRAARACLPRAGDHADGLLSLVSPVAVPPGGEREVERLMELALAAASHAAAMDLGDIAERMSTTPRWPNIWPGEHYRLLAALTARIRPKSVVEIGTFLGLSALAMKETLPAQARIVTFDLLPWNSFPATCLRPADFADGRLRQELGDLAQPEVFRAHAGLLAQSELIFLDGPKNRTFERAFLGQLATLPFAAPTLLVIDDIRLWSMLDIWREIPFPKLDVTSLGHFSGTGLVRLGPR